MRNDCKPPTYRNIQHRIEGTLTSTVTRITTCRNKWLCHFVLPITSDTCEILSIVDLPTLYPYCIDKRYNGRDVSLFPESCEQLTLFG